MFKSAYCALHSKIMKGECKMIRIHLLTGTAWTRHIDVEGDMNSDLIQLVDYYYQEHGTLPVPMYTFSDLLEMFTGYDYSIDENSFSTTLDSMHSINGGEYYIEGIEWVEEI